MHFFTFFSCLPCLWPTKWLEWVTWNANELMMAEGDVSYAEGEQELGSKRLQLKRYVPE